MSADINLRFCTALSVAGTDTTTASTDWVDFKAAQDNAGGKSPVVEIIPTTVGANVGTVRFEIGAVDSSGANFAILDTTKQYAATALVPGQVRIIMKMDPQTALPGSTLTHIRVRAVTVGAVTGLAITAQMAEEEVTSHPLKTYAAGY